MAFNHQNIAQRTIREYILLHRAINLNGGVSPSSKLHLDFIEQQKRVLNHFGLPQTHHYTINMLIYPFSCAHLRRKVFWEFRAGWGYCESINAYGFAGGLAIGYPNDNIRFGSIWQQAAFIYNQLLKQAFEYHKNQHK